LKLLGAPATLAILATSLALVAHPATGLRDGRSWGPVAVAALALLVTAGFVARAVSGAWSDRILAVGAVALVAGLGADGVRGYQGVLTLRPGQGANRFEQEGAQGRPAGLRPLGFEAGLVRATNDEAVVSLVPPGREARLTAERGTSQGGLRFANPVAVATGEVARLTVVLDSAAGPRSVALEPGLPSRSGDLELEIERYFPDFALDERQQPFTRSLEARNPAALLRVTRGGRAFRVFVIRSLPGVHKVDDLGLSFALTAVVPETATRLHVVHEPFAAAVAAAGLLLLAGTMAAHPWRRSAG
jgi:hypothetical protein